MTRTDDAFGLADDLLRPIVTASATVTGARFEQALVLAICAPGMAPPALVAGIEALVARVLDAPGPTAGVVLPLVIGAHRRGVEPVDLIADLASGEVPLPLEWSEYEVRVATAEARAVAARYATRSAEVATGASGVHALFGADDATAYLSTPVAEHLHHAWSARRAAREGRAVAAPTGCPPEVVVLAVRQHLLTTGVELHVSVDLAAAASVLGRLAAVAGPPIPDLAGTIERGRGWLDPLAE